MENVWQYLRGNRLAITVLESYDEIVDKASSAWTFFASDQARIASIATRYGQWSIPRAVDITGPVQSGTCL
jgi:hypothetical protein